uniref:Uncharacterized protein n=1 Tax=Romanomermis culicivorax TaxID=13658 RepID=A0A915HYG0_ROMCU
MDYRGCVTCRRISPSVTQLPFVIRKASWDRWAVSPNIGIFIRVLRVGVRTAALSLGIQSAIQGEVADTWIIVISFNLRFKRSPKICSQAAIKSKKNPSKTRQRIKFELETANQNTRDQAINLRIESSTDMACATAQHCKLKNELTCISGNNHKTAFTTAAAILCLVTTRSLAGVYLLSFFDSFSDSLSEGELSRLDIAIQI